MPSLQLGGKSKSPPTKRGKSSYLRKKEVAEMLQDTNSNTLILGVSLNMSIESDAHENSVPNSVDVKCEHGNETYTNKYLENAAADCPPENDEYFGYM